MGAGVGDLLGIPTPLQREKERQRGTGDGERGARSVVYSLVTVSRRSQSGTVVLSYYRQYINFWWEEGEEGMIAIFYWFDVVVTPKKLNDQYVRSPSSFNAHMYTHVIVYIFI